MNLEKPSSFVAGLILAAGRSERMGTPKSNLAWGTTTVLGQVIRSLGEGGLKCIYVVINPFRKPEIPEGLTDLKVVLIENPAAETSEMLKSIQIGLSSLPEEVQSVMVALGDQPTIRSEVIRKILQTVDDTGEGLIFPSYRHRRGHPWTVNREFWSEICSLSENETARTFIQAHASTIHYVNFDLDPPEDMDTPEMYQHLKHTSGM